MGPGRRSPPAANIIPLCRSTLFPTPYSRLSATPCWEPDAAMLRRAPTRFRERAKLDAKAATRLAARCIRGYVFSRTSPAKWPWREALWSVAGQRTGCRLVAPTRRLRGRHPLAFRSCRPCSRGAALRHHLEQAQGKKRQLVGRRAHPKTNFSSTWSPNSPGGRKKESVKTEGTKLKCL